MVALRRFIKIIRFLQVRLPWLRQMGMEKVISKIWIYLALREIRNG